MNEALKKRCMGYEERITLLDQKMTKILEKTKLWLTSASITINQSSSLSAHGCFLK